MTDESLVVHLRAQRATLQQRLLIANLLVTNPNTKAPVTSATFFAFSFLFNMSCCRSKLAFGFYFFFYYACFLRLLSKFYACLCKSVLLSATAASRAGETLVSPSPVSSLVTLSRSLSASYRSAIESSGHAK